MAKKKPVPTTGNDILPGTDDNDVIDGLAGNDRISTGKGNDTLTGNLGKDTLNGGAGVDIFRYLAAADSASASGKWSKATGDTILGFKPGTDKIDLSALGPLSFGAAGAKKGVWTEVAGKATYVHADTTGDGVADLSIKLAGKKTLSAGDFVVAQALPPVGTVTLQVAGDNTVSAGEIANGNVTLTGVVTGDAKAGDTVTLTVNGKAVTGQVGADLKYTANVALADILTDADKTIEVKVGVTSPTGTAGTIEGKATYALDAAKPVITFANTTVNENTTAVDKATASMPVTWSLGGADKGFFSVAADGTISFTAAPDYENKKDAGANNVYDIVLTATNALGVSESKPLAVTVANVVETANVTGIVIKDKNGNAFAEGALVGIGTEVHFYVTFDNNVVVTGTPGILLNAVNGGTQAKAVLAAQNSGSGTNTLHFVYNVQPGESSPIGVDLKATGFAGDASNTIKSQDGAAAVFVAAAGDPPGTITVDGVKPAAPELSVDSTSVNGVFNGKIISVTSDAQPDFSGGVDTDVVKVKLYRDNVFLADVTPAGGQWSYTEGAGWTEGVHEVKAIAYDAAGNASDDQVLTIGVNAQPVKQLVTSLVAGSNLGSAMLTDGAFSSASYHTIKVSGQSDKFETGDSVEATVKLVQGTGTDANYAGSGKTFTLVQDQNGDWSYTFGNNIAKPGENLLGGNLSSYEIVVVHKDIFGNAATSATYSFGRSFAEINTNGVIGGLSDDFLIADETAAVPLVLGNDGNDTIYGSSKADTLKGEAGNDIINGGAGYDSLLGGDGDDFLFAQEDGAELTGGAGKDEMTGNSDIADTFIFSVGDSLFAAGQSDTIWDFKSGLDKIKVTINEQPSIITLVGNYANTFDSFTALANNNAFNSGYNIFFMRKFAGGENGLLAIDANTNDRFDSGDIFVTLHGVDTIADTDFLLN